MRLFFYVFARPYVRAFTKRRKKWQERKKALKKKCAKV
nr:MAG TPA: hypothetical protein [Caudoviricetes sp.]